MTKDARQPDGNEPKIDLTTLPTLVEQALATHSEKNFGHGALAKALSALGARKIEDSESSAIMYDLVSLHPRAKAALAEILRPHASQLTRPTPANPHLPPLNIIELRGKQEPFPQPTNVLLVEFNTRGKHALITQPRRIEFYREVTFPPRRY